MSLTKLFSVLVGVVLVFSLLQVPAAFSGEVAESERMVAFMEDVVQLDLDHYSMTLSVGGSDKRSDLGGLLEENFKYYLKSDESSLGVLFKFIDGRLSRCGIYVYEGSPVYTQSPPEGVLAMSQGLLQRYQSFVRSSGLSAELSTMRDMLSMVDNSENTVTLGNVKLEVKDDNLDWVHTFNGVELHALGLSFRDGHLFTLDDDRNLFTMGSTEVEVSRKEALNLAVNYAEFYSWNISVEDGWKKITDFQILENSSTAELRSYPREDPSTLYPYWYVTLPLGEVYPGMVYRLQVGVWADSGEIIFCQALGTGAVATTPTTDTSDGKPSSGDLAPILVAIPAFSAIILLGAVIYNKKIKQ